MTIKIVAVLIILIAVCQSQVSPIWSSTPRIDTGDVILVNSGLATTNWTTLWTTTYSAGAVFSAAPWVGLCINIFIFSNQINQNSFKYSTNWNFFLFKFSTINNKFCKSSRYCITYICLVFKS
jgi:hypothetical protein